MIVVDASVVIKLVTREPGAYAALARIVAEEERWAPGWMRLEVANALARKVRDDGLPFTTANAALAAVEHYVTNTVDSIGLLDETFALALRIRHAMYDCLYLALALRYDSIVVTHDVGFVRACKQAGLTGNVELLS